MFFGTHCIKQLQSTQLLAQVQPETKKPELETKQHEHAQEPDPEPEPSSDHEPFAVLLDNIENPAFAQIMLVLSSSNSWKSG